MELEKKIGEIIENIKKKQLFGVFCNISYLLEDYNFDIDKTVYSIKEYILSINENNEDYNKIIENLVFNVYNNRIDLVKEDLCPLLDNTVNYYVDPSDINQSEKYFEYQNTIKKNQEKKLKELKKMTNTLEYKIDDCNFIQNKIINSKNELSQKSKVVEKRIDDVSIREELLKQKENELKVQFEKIKKEKNQIKFDIQQIEESHVIIDKKIKNLTELEDKIKEIENSFNKKKNEKILEFNMREKELNCFEEKLLEKEKKLLERENLLDMKSLDMKSSKRNNCEKKPLLNTYNFIYSDDFDKKEKDGQKCWCNIL